MHCSVGLGGVDLDRNHIVLRRAGKAIVAVELLRSLAQRVAVVRPFVDDVNRLPGMQPDHQSDQVIVCPVRRIDVPGEAMRIAQAIRPNLFPGAGFRRERIIVRDTVTFIVADRTAVDMLFDVRDNAKDFTHQHVETLRIAADAGCLLTVAAVAGRDVHDAPVGSPGRAVGLKVRSAIG